MQGGRGGVDKRVPFGDSMRLCGGLKVVIGSRIKHNTTRKGT